MDDGGGLPGVQGLVLLRRAVPGTRILMDETRSCLIYKDGRAPDPSTPLPQKHTTAEQAGLEDGAGAAGQAGARAGEEAPGGQLHPRHLQHLRRGRDKEPLLEGTHIGLVGVGPSPLAWLGAACLTDRARSLANRFRLLIYLIHSPSTGARSSGSGRPSSTCSSWVSPRQIKAFYKRLFAHVNAVRASPCT